VYDDVLTIEEAGRFLKVAPDIVSGLLERDEIPGRQIGGQWRTTKRALISYVDGVSLEGCCPPGVCCTPVASQGAADGACCQPNDGGCC
jgi:hypothetical protein